MRPVLDVALPAPAPDMPLTERAVTAIEQITDAALRNLWITQSYADLAERLLGVLHTDQTWCTFAIWASNTAGVSIRGEELPRVVSEALLGADEQVDAVARAVNGRLRILRRLGLVRDLQHSHLEHLVAAAVAQVATHIAHGNTLVYGELAPLFVRVLEAVESNDVPNEAMIGEWLDACGVPSSTDAPLVRAAFTAYLRAVIATEPAARAQHALAANISAVLHEQQRLQPDIVAALDAGVVDFGDDMAGVIRHVLPGFIRTRLLASVRRHVAPHVESLWQHVATKLLMTLSVPGATLHLGRPVPPLPDGTMWPHLLVELHLDELLALWQQWGPTDNEASAAHDWADLHQRMRYIVTLFRSRQQQLDLTIEPFTDEQLSWMAKGSVPPHL
jgi:hypothetical protein